MICRFSRSCTLLFDEPASASAPSMFGPYRVLHQIGSGVLGAVFRGHDPRQDRLVAIKAFGLDLLPEQSAALAETLRALVRTAPEHRAAVSVLGAGLEGHTPYLAMSFDTGEPLDQILRRGGVADLDRAAALVGNLAEVIDRFWNDGFGHGGLHPRDVFVTAGGGVRVTGFGVSQALASAGIGWPGRRPYAAPERASGAWDVRADVYALGVIAHELLTGRRPVAPGEQDGEFGPAVAVSQRARLRRTLAAALAARPQDRFATATELAAELAGILGRTLGVPTPGVPTPGVPTPGVATPGELTPGVATPGVATPGVLDDLQLRPETSAFAYFESEELPLAEVESEAVAFFDRRRELADAPVLGEPPAEGSRRWALMSLLGLAGVALGSLLVLAAERHFSRDDPADPAAVVASAESPVGPDARAATAGSASGVSAASQAARAPDPAAAPPSGTPSSASGPSRGAGGGRRLRPAPAPATPRAPRPAGTVVVRSQPSGSLVTINGRLLGETPVTARDLPLGSHVVQVARPGYVPRQTRVTLTAAAPSQNVSLSLDRGLAQADGAAPDAAVARPSAGEAGAIDVDSRPRGARVSVDGQFVGHAPLRVADLPPGSHALTLEHPGYSGASRRVRVESGEVARLVVFLE